MTRLLMCTAAFIILLLPQPARSDGDALLGLASEHYNNGEYYNAITETMRYQHLYPGGALYPDSLLLMGKAYFRGNNPGLALDTMVKCFESYRDTPQGEAALLYSGHIRLLSDSPYYAHRTYLTYEYLYKKGKYSEDAHLEKCYSLALIGELEEAKREIESYAKLYQNGVHNSKLNDLRNLIDNETMRERKSLPLALGVSAVIPGFGHFYAGKAEVGLFTFITNAALFFLAYDGYRDGNVFRMVVFGMAGLSFYQHSLFSAAGNVYNYNSRERFNRNVMMSISSRF